MKKQRIRNLKKEYHIGDLDIFWDETVKKFYEQLKYNAISFRDNIINLEEG